jgi:thymidylate kinase
MTKPTAAMTILEQLDTALTDRVLVFGSLPPDGRDIDLLARSAQLDSIEGVLSATGFSHNGDQWVRFERCTADVIEVVPAIRWDLPPSELAALFDDAVPLDGLAKVVRPAPHHALLILARRLLHDPRALNDERRRRIAEALAGESEAWSLAQVSAPVWGASAPLALLERTCGPSANGVQGGGSARPPAEMFGMRRRRLLGRARRAARLGARRSRLITLSGLDGAGKSSQALALQDALERVGFTVAVEWAPSHSLTRLLNFLAAPAKAIASARSSVAPEAADRSAAARSAEQRRERIPPIRHSALVAHGWATILTIAQSVALWRLTFPHLGRGRIIISDRYACDVAVYLRYRHGEGRSFRVETALLRALTPKCWRAYLLEVSSETAFKRKPEQFLLEELRTQADLYRGEAAAFGLRRLDGERPRDELCAEIASDVWRALHSSSD